MHPELAGDPTRLLEREDLGEVLVGVQGAMGVVRRPRRVGEAPMVVDSPGSAFWSDTLQTQAMIRLG